MQQAKDFWCARCGGREDADCICGYDVVRFVGSSETHAPTTRCSQRIHLSANYTAFKRMHPSTNYKVFIYACTSLPITRCSHNARTPLPTTQCSQMHAPLCQLHAVHNANTCLPTTRCPLRTHFSTNYTLLITHAPLHQLHGVHTFMHPSANYTVFTTHATVCQLHGVSKVEDRNLVFSFLPVRFCMTQTAISS